MFVELCEISEEVAIEVAKYGATQTIIDDLRKYTRGVNIFSSYLIDLLEFMAKVCKHSQGLVNIILNALLIGWVYISLLHRQPSDVSRLRKRRQQSECSTMYNAFGKNIRKQTNSTES